MPTFVLDCSVTIAYFFQDEDSPHADAVFELFAHGWEARAPSVWSLEIANTCMTALRKNRITLPDILEIFYVLKTFPVRMAPPVVVTSLYKTITLAEQHRLTAYDAAYLELALREGLPLATLDKELIRAAEECGVAIARDLT